MISKRDSIYWKKVTEDYLKVRSEYAKSRDDQKKLGSNVKRLLIFFFLLITFLIVLSNYENLILRQKGKITHGVVTDIKFGKNVILGLDGSYTDRVYVEFSFYDDEGQFISSIREFNTSEYKKSFIPSLEIGDTIVVQYDEKSPKKNDILDK